MLNALKRIFGDATPDAPPSERGGDAVQVATCALFLEMARIDAAFSEAELSAVLGILEDRYGLDPEDADALMKEAEAELKTSVDYWQFARLINQNFSMAEKEAIIETLWRIVFVDGKLDAHEDYLMHKLSNLLRLSHKQLIDAKLRAMEGG